MAEGGGDFLGDLACAIQFAGSEGDCGDAGMSPATILFAQGGEVYLRRRLFPGIRAHGNFRARGRRAHADGIEAVRMTDSTE